jgi:glutathione synthase/RimK-type ligase-like ATP-grasp enzyme
VPEPLVALATGADLTERDDDLPPLIAALGRRGVSARPAPWDDRREDWARYDLVVVRSTWDYVSRVGEFLTWAGSVPRLANPVEVLRWNVDKRYLSDLGGRGIPVVPTEWVPVGCAASLRAGGVVVKPSVGNGALGAGRFDPGEEELAHRHIATLHRAGKLVLVQPYLDRLDVEGETGLVMIAGEFSHAINKRARLTVGGGQPVPYSGSIGVSPCRAEPRQLALAARVLAALPFPTDRLLYARVDLAPGPDGAPLLMELELTEPALFLDLGDGALERMASAIADRLAAGR